jgi:hypothetical protein
MTPKRIAIQTIIDLPDDASWDDVQDRIRFVADVHESLKDLDEGHAIPHAQVKKEFTPS